MSDEIEKTLSERGKRYGEYVPHANLVEKIVADLLYDTRLPLYMRHAIRMIVEKLVRAANGDPLYDDNWRDIAGYATLVLKELEKDNVQQ